MIWGGRSLEALNKPLAGEGPYGESWEVSDHPGHRSVVADGSLAGRTLRHLMEEDPQGLVGPSSIEVFPWLIKFLDCHDWLSVQVHPDGENVGRLWPGEGPKTEAWFVLSARPGSRVYAGLKPGVDAEVLRRAVLAGTAADCLSSFEPRPGDCLFLRAGTVHAVGGGVVMAEVQQTSDATFRLYDWGRVGLDGKPRELHVDRALECIDWSAGPATPVRAEGFGEEGTSRQKLVSCPFFELEYRREREPFSLGGTGRLMAVLALHGRAVAHSPEGARPLAAGDTLVLPAAANPAWITPDGCVGVLCAELPGS
jgi:mannose-6-phosphate isomerase